MASDVMSLFGLDPNTIQQNRTNDAVSQASAMNPYFAAGAAGGSLVGQGINSAFGLQTPEMAQAQSVKDGLQGADLETVKGMRKAASQLMMNGNYAQAMQLHAMASKMESEAIEEKRVSQTHSLGSTHQVVVGQTKGDGLGGGIKDIKHTVTYLPDGKVEDATLGKTFKSRAAWLEALGNPTDTQVVEKPNSQDLLDALKNGTPIPNGASATAEQILGTEASPEVIQAKDAKIQQTIDALTAQITELPMTMQGSPRVIQIQERIDALRSQLSGAAPVYESSGSESSY